VRLAKVDLLFIPEKMLLQDLLKVEVPVFFPILGNKFVK